MSAGFQRIKMRHVRGLLVMSVAATQQSEKFSLSGAGGHVKFHNI